MKSIRKFKTTFSLIFKLFLSLSSLSIYAEGPGDDGSTDSKPSDPTEVVLPSNFTGEFPNEQVVLQSGELMFTVDDVRIPGPNGMDVVFSRQFASLQNGAETFRTLGASNWSINIPKIRTTHDGEPGPNLPRPKCRGIDNIAIKVDGKMLGSSIGQPSSSLGNKRNAILLSDNYLLENCNTIFTPDGRKVTFIEFEHNYRPDGTYEPTYSVKQYYVSKIEDRFGNAINYTYERVNITTPKGRSYRNLPILKKISNTEGSELTVQYIDRSSAPKISQINYNGKSIKYRYGGTHNNLLQEVEDALGRKTKYQWGFTENRFRRKLIKLDKVTLHTGASVSYQYEFLSPDDPKVCSISLPCREYTLSVKSQSITGPGLALKSIRYTRHHFANRIEVTKSTAIGGETKRDKYTFRRIENTRNNANNGLSALNNRLIKEETFDGSTKIYEKKNDWEYITLGDSGCTRFGVEAYKQCAQARLTKETKTFYYSDGSDSFYRKFSNFNTYGTPQKVHEWNNFNSNNRYTLQDYSHSKLHWVLNKPTRTRVSSDGNSYTETRKITYHSDTGSYKGAPNYLYQFGRWVKRNSSYHTSGTNKGVPKRIQLNATNRWIEFDNYKRGKAQTITRALPVGTGNMTQSQTIDENGRVKSSTDFKGNTTRYNYDSFGRLRAIDLPNDSTFGSWQDTLFTWNDSTNTRTIKRCILNSVRTGCRSGVKFTTTEYYDSLMRLTKKRQVDNAHNGLNASTRYSYYAYDHNNQPTFTSYPYTSDSVTAASIANNSAKGSYITYDKLRRKTNVASTGRGDIDYEYLTDNKIRVRDALSNQTTTTYQAFGSPNYEIASKIESPAGISTDFNVDVFGFTHTIKQSGYGKSLTETRKYDSHKQLCLIQRADVGNTVLKYNALGEVIWQKQGVTNTSCVNSAPTNSTHFTYDNLGDVRSINYPGSDLDVTYTRDKNGNITNLIAGNVVHNYSYNNLNLLEDEHLTVDDNTLQLDYEYNSLGHKKAVTYPDGTYVDYAPNSFGDPTQAVSTDMSFATNIQYHANGMINTFSYGNGVKHTTMIDPHTQLPDVVQDLRGSEKIVKLGYSFDNNSNVKSITDHQNSHFSLTNLVYDGLDRLTDVSGNGGIGNSTIRYDALGNITSYTSKHRSLSYSYNGNNRLIRVTGSGTDGKYASIGYDSRGNITHNGKFALSFNYANQLSSAKGNTYLYDGHNRRVKQVDGKGTSYSMYSQDGILMYREKGGFKGDGTNYIYLGKKLIAKYGDVSFQSLAESRQHYRPFGESIEAPKDDVGYTGHKFDTDLGLSYMQARYYDPVIGRFYSNDPVGSLEHMQRGNSISHGFNRYAYANNNPYKYTDPDGEFIQLVGAVIGGLTAYHSASVDGATGAELILKTAVGALVGGVTGGLGSAKIGLTTIKQGMKIAEKASTAQKVANVAKGAGLGAASGVTSQLATDAIDGELSSTGDLINAGGKGAVAASTGAALGTGTFGPTVLGKGLEAVTSGATEVLINEVDDKVKK